MSLRFLLDTNIVSAAVAKIPNGQVLDRLAEHAGGSAIASVVWHELMYGCRRLPAGRRRAALETYLDEVVRPSFPILPYDEAAAAWHAQERARLESRGVPAPYVDGQIAAIAHTHGLILATANPKDFAGFQDLDVQDWTKRRRK